MSVTLFRANQRRVAQLALAKHKPCAYPKSKPSALGDHRDTAWCLPALLALALILFV